MADFKLKTGLVHVYTGDGKGKTTAALGVALRVLGWGGRACMIQFIKGYARIGEAQFADESAGRFVLRQFAETSVRDIPEQQVLARKEAAERALVAAADAIRTGEFDLVILDEVNNALHYRLIHIERVLQLLRDRPAHVEIILTGRNAPTALIDAADYVTDMRLIKHPYQQDVQAREGVDF
jgi:cob(I)alamin adenosyltransferase